MPTTERTLSLAPFYRWELDVVRVSAFFMVFCQHALPQHGDSHGHATDVLTLVAYAGGFGVRLFFVLSAFLLTRLLLVEHRKTGSIDVRAFYTRRTLRIWPLYFVFVLACVLLRDSLILPGIEPGHLFGTVTFTLNWFQGLDRNVVTSISGIMWSVAVEEQMYVIWPLLLIVLLRRNLIVPGFIVLGLLGILARLVIAVAGVHYPAVWVLTPTAFDSFAIGALLAYATERVDLRMTKVARIALITGGLAIPLVLTRWLDLDVYQDRHAVWTYLAINLAAAAGLAGALGDSRLTGTSPSSVIARVLVWGGRRTYGLYVWHRLALALVIMALTNGTESKLPLFPVALAVTAAMAAVSYVVVELPFLRIKSRIGKVASAPV